jgi:hypothetical protein
MSKTLVQLAADLASFNNTSVDDALVALRSGLSGEAEPLKRYGIALSDARMRQELMAQGVKDLGATLTPLQKTQAAYTLILKDSKLAQGDFARTSTGLANEQRIAAASSTTPRRRSARGKPTSDTTKTDTLEGVVGLWLPRRETQRECRRRQGDRRPLAPVLRQHRGPEGARRADHEHGRGRRQARR